MSAEAVAEAPGRAGQKGKRPAAPARKKSGAEGALEAPGHAVRERLLAGGGMSPDRLPMLRVILDGMASAFEDGLRKLSFPTPKFTVDSVTAARSGDASALMEGCALTATYGGVEPDSRIVVGVERKFIFAMVEGLFGADGSEPFYVEERAFTGVETRLGRSALDRIAKALQGSFATVAGAAIAMEPIEVKPDAPAAPRKASACLICRCKLAAFGCDSDVVVTIPQFVLDPLRGTLAQDPAVTIQSADPQWAQRMKARVTRTEVSLSAVMEKRDLTLGDIARFEVGQIIELPITPTGLIKLECEGQALFWCEIGQKDGAYTIRIEDFVDKEQEFIDDVLGA